MPRLPTVLVLLSQVALSVACSDAQGDGTNEQPTAGASVGGSGTAGDTNLPNGGGTSGASSVAGSADQGGAVAAGGTNGGVAGASAGAAGGPGEEPSSLPGCALSFPYQDEPALGTWLGGDSAYSTTISPSTALWSFQDTFVGDHGQTGRQGAGIIANSVALVSCENGVQSIRYVWKPDGSKAIFSDGVANQRFWPQQPIIYKGFLFVAMTRVQGVAEEIGTALARVSNPYDSPEQWQIEYFELAQSPGLGKGTIVVDGYAYLFGHAGQVIVTRLPLDELIKPTAVPTALIEYLAADGTWKQGLNTGDAKKLGFAANVGTSFRYLEESGQWLSLFTSTASWPSRSIAISTAPQLEGPWSKPVTVYEVPEMTTGSPEYDKDTVCYAAIEHTESNPHPEADLLFSYTCNSLVASKQIANMGIYLPKIVSMKNPVLN